MRVVLSPPSAHHQKSKSDDRIPEPSTRDPPTFTRRRSSAQRSKVVTRPACGTTAAGASGDAREPRELVRDFALGNVYSRCMVRIRTNIEIEDVYVRTIMTRYGVPTKTDAVELALRHLAGQPMTREEALAMRGAHAIDEPPADFVSHATA